LPLAAASAVGIVLRAMAELTATARFFANVRC
jgi:hypothetical protein